MQERPQPLFAFMACISVNSSTLSCSVLTTPMSLVTLVAIFSTESSVMVIFLFSLRYAILGRRLGRSMI